jgi:hypothetical protein
MLFRRRNQILACILCLLLLLPACTSAPPSRFEQTQIETTQRGAAPAVAKDAESGASFNRFFPAPTDGFAVVPAQEKKGFAEYKLKQGGEDVAMLSINDTLGTPAAEKFKQSSFTVAGYPAVDQGATTTALLVGDRYQVKVLSRADSFSRDARLAWLEKFDLQGLANLN